MTVGDLCRQLGNTKLGNGARIGALAHDEISSARTTGIAGPAGQNPRADDHPVAQDSGGGRSSIRSPGQVSFQFEGIARRNCRHHREIQRARNLAGGTGVQGSGAALGRTVDPVGKAFSGVEETEAGNSEGPAGVYRERGHEIQQTRLVGPAIKLSLPTSGGRGVGGGGRNRVTAAAADCQFQRQHDQARKLLHEPSLKWDHYENREMRADPSMDVRAWYWLN